MARDYTGRQTTDKRSMDLATKVSLLLLGILFLLAAIITPLVVLMSKTSHGTISYGDFIYQYNIKDGNVYYDIKKYIGQKTENVIIPSEYNGAPVVGILKDAFNGNSSNVCRNIKQITFDYSGLGGISRIDSNAFVGLESLREFYLPNEITTIADDAFKNCIIGGDFVVEDLGAYHENNNGIVGDHVSISQGAFDNCVVGGKLIISNASEGIVPGEVLNAFGYLGASECELRPNVDVFNLGTDSFASFADLTTLTIYTSGAKNIDNVYTKANFNMVNCKKLKNLNVLYGTAEKVVYNLTQKFVEAPIENVYFGKSITELGARTFEDFNNLTHITVNNNQVTDINGNVTATLGMTIDRNIMKNASYNNLTIEFENENNSVSNVIKIAYDNQTVTNPSYNGYSSIVDQTFMRVFNRKAIRELTIGSNITGVVDGAFNDVFTSTLPTGESYKLNFEVVGENDYSAIESGSLSARIFNSIPERQNAIIANIDVTGPRTAGGSNAIIYQMFNTTEGTYNNRKSYNGQIDWGDAKYVITFDYNLPDLRPEGFNGQLSFLSTTVTNMQVITLPIDVNATTNEFALIGWAQNGNGDGTGTGTRYTAGNMQNGTFVFKAEEWTVETGSDGKSKRVTMFALWEEKTYYTFNYYPQFNQFEIDGINPYVTASNRSEYYKQNISYETGRVFEGSTLGLGAIVYFHEDGTPFKPGEIFDRDNGDYSEFIVSMPVVYQSGYTFMGWNTLPDGSGQVINENTVCTQSLVEGESIDVYGQWEKIAYNIIYHATTQDFVMANTATVSESLGYNDALVLKTGVELGAINNAFNIAGYSFVGWSLNDSITENSQIKFSVNEIINNWQTDKLTSDLLYSLYGESYANKDGTINLNSTMFNAKDVHLYGIYEENSYTISYNLNLTEHDAPASIENAVIKYAGNEDSLTLALGSGILKIGYTFAGWGVKLEDGSISPALYNLMDENGDEIASTVSAIELIRVKYNLGESGLIEYEHALSQTIEIVAIWKANELNVTFNANGGTGSESILFTFNGELALSDGSAFSRAGHSIIGWGINASDKAFDVSAIVTGEQLLKVRYNVQADGALTYEQAQTNSLNLYAIWETHSYTLIIDFGDGTQPIEMEVTYGLPYDSLSSEELSKHEKTGYYFEGVYTGENGTGTKLWNEDGSPSSNSFGFDFASDDEPINVFVNWARVTYEFNYNVNTRVGGEEITNNALGCAINVLANETELVSSSGVAVGDIIKITYLPNSAFVFAGLYAVTSGTNLNDLGAEGTTSVNLGDAGININEFTITDTFIENYLFNNAFHLIALFRAKEFVAEFKVDDVNFTVADWGIDDNSGYEYLYDEDNNIIGIKSIIVYGKNFAYVKFIDGDNYGELPLPVLTLSNGHFNNWVIKTGSVNQLINAETLVNDSTISGLSNFEDGAVISLYATCSEYEVYNITIKTPSLYSDAYNGFSLVQNYAEGGSQSFEGMQTYIENLRKDATISLTLKVKDGYIITNIRQDGSTIAVTGADNEKTVEFVMPAKDVEFEIIARPITYTVRFDNNNINAQGSMTTQSFTFGETKALNANRFTLIGHDFLGWAKDNSAITPEFADQEEVSNLSVTDGETVVLYAVWKEKVYTVVYNSNGGEGEMESQTGLTYGGSVVLVPFNFTKTGYTIVADVWYFSENKTTDSGINSSNPLISELVSLAISAGQDTESTNTITLYARWTANEHTVTLDALGGEFSGDMHGWVASGSDGQVATKTIAYDSEFGTLPTPIKTVTGKNVVFVGWFKEQTFENQVNSSTKFDVDSDITLYAQYIEEEYSYTLNINPNGGKYNGNSGITQVGYHYDDTLEALATEAVREGYIFTGWWDNSNGTGTKYDSTSTMPDKELNVFAGWTAITYYVNYNKVNDNATGSTAQSTHVYDTASNLSPNGFTLIGYTFAGWAISNENALLGIIEYTDGESVLNLANTQDAQVELFAVYSSNIYTLWFNNNYGDGYNNGQLDKTSIQVNYGEALPDLAVFTSLPTKLGYNLTFDGWFAEENKTNKIEAGMVFTDELVTNIDHETRQANIYAGWSEEALPFGLTLNANGGQFEELTNWVLSPDKTTATNTTTIFYGELIGALPSVSKTVVGYDVNLAGWFIDFNGNGAQDAGETFTNDALMATRFNWTTALTAQAIWTETPRADTPFVVYHYLQNLDGSYSLHQTQMQQGVTGATLILSNFALTDSDYVLSGGKFIYSYGALSENGAQVTQTTISAVNADATETTDGITKLYLYYSRQTHELVLQLTTGIDRITTNPSATKQNNYYTITLKYEQTIDIEAVAVQGYTFTNWQLVSGNINFNANLASQTLTMGTTDATLKANAQASEFTLTLYANGGAITENAGVWTGSGNVVTKTIKYGSQIGTLPSESAGTISRTGKTLSGWTTSADGGGTAYTESSTMPAQNLALYAIWEDIEYTITLNKTSEHYSNITASGAEVNGNRTALTVKYGSSVTLNITLVEGVWISATSFNNPLITDLNYNSAGRNVTVTFTYSLTSNSTLTLTTQMVSYNIVYIGNGGLLNGSAKVEQTGIIYNNTITINSRITSKTYANHTFTNWQVSYNGESGTYTEYTGSNLPKPQVSGVEDISKLNNTTVYLKAIWRVNEYTINFAIPEEDENGNTIGREIATLSNLSSKVAYGNSYKLIDLTKITLYGSNNAKYTMKGWKVYVSNNLIENAYLDENPDFTAGGTQSNTLTLNFNSNDAWFNYLSLEDGDVITIEADIVITEVTVTLNLVFEGIANLQNSTLSTELDYWEKAMQLSGETFSVQVEKTVRQLVEDYIASVGSKMFTVTGNLGEEQISFAGFKLDTKRTLGLDNIISYTGDEQQFTVYFTRNIYDIVITTFSDKYTHVGATAKLYNNESGFVSLLLPSTYTGSDLICLAPVSIADNTLVFEMSYNSGLNLTSNNFTRTGFNFKTFSVAGQESNAVDFTIDENFINNNFSTITTLNIEIEWTIIPITITFEEVDGTFASSNADPNSSSLSGFASTGTANVLYNEEKDLYYNRSTGKFYRIIPKGTRVGGINSFMPTPIRDYNGDFRGWFLGSIESVPITENGAALDTSKIFNIYDIQLNDSLSMGDPDYVQYALNAGEYTSQEMVITGDSYGVSEGSDTTQTEDYVYRKTEGYSEDYLFADSRLEMFMFTTAGKVDATVSATISAWGMTTVEQFNNYYDFNGNSFSASIMVYLYKKTSTGWEIMGDIQDGFISPSASADAYVSSITANVKDTSTLSIPEAGTYVIWAQASAAGPYQLATAGVSLPASAEKVTMVEQCVPSSSQIMSYTKATDNTTLYGAYKTPIIFNANPNGLSLPDFRATSGDYQFDSDYKCVELVNSGSYIPNISVTARGFAFLGWFTKPNGEGTKLTSTTKALYSEVNYYGHWQQAIIVEFWADGTSAVSGQNNSVSVSDMNLGANYTLSVQTTGGYIRTPALSNFNRLGYVASGWVMRTSSGAEKTVSSTSQTYINPTELADYMEGDVLKIWLKWTASNDFVTTTFVQPNANGNFTTLVTYTINNGDTFALAQTYSNVRTAITFPQTPDIETITNGNYRLRANSSVWVTSSYICSSVDDLDASTRTDFNINTSVTSSGRVYLNAVGNYTIHFIQNSSLSDNTEILILDNVYQGLSITLPTNLSNYGYRYVGWNSVRQDLISGATKPSSKAQIIYQGNYNSINKTWTPTESQLSSFANESHEIYLYAVWGKLYNLVFTASNGTISGSNVVTSVCHGDTQGNGGFTAPSISRPGQYDNTWVYSKNTNVALSSVDTSYVESDNLTINIEDKWQAYFLATYYKWSDSTNDYTVWEIVKFYEQTYHYVKDGSSLTRKGTNGVYPDVQASCVGWDTSSSGSNVVYEFGDTVRNNNYNFYAVYMNDIRVSFVYSTSSGTSTYATRFAKPNTTLNESASYGGDYGMPSGGPVVEGYNFLGWTTKFMGQGSPNFNGSTVITSSMVSSGHIQVWAVLEIKTYTVNINRNNGDKFLADINGSELNSISLNHGDGFTIEISLFNDPNYYISVTGSNCSISPSNIYYTDSNRSVSVTNVTSNTTISITARTATYNYNIFTSNANLKGSYSGTITSNDFPTTSISVTNYEWSGVLGNTHLFTVSGKYFGSDAYFNVSGMSNTGASLYSIRGRYSISYNGLEGNISGVAVSSTNASFVVQSGGKYTNYSTLQEAYNAVGSSATIMAYQSGTVSIGNGSISISAKAVDGSGSMAFNVSMSLGGSVNISKDATTQVGVTVSGLTVSGVGQRISIYGANTISIQSPIGSPGSEFYLYYTSGASVSIGSGWTKVSDSGGTARFRYGN